MTGFPKVAVVILNWNGKQHLEQFLPSVTRSEYPNLEIIIGDNASTDGSIEFLRDHYPELRIIRNTENYGFAGGYNAVLSQVVADYYVLLNSDVEVSPRWITPVIEMMESDRRIAAAQPKLLSFRQPTHFEYAGAAGGYLDVLGYPFCRGRIFDSVEEDNGQYDDNTEVFWATGAALFIRSSCWEESGGLDADFFAHMEEIDLCWRLKKLGYRIMYCGQSTVYHLGGGTLNAESPYKTYLNFRNNLVMLQKNMGTIRAGLVIFIRLWLDLLTLLKFLADRKPANARAINKAHTNFFRNFFRTAGKRRPQSVPFNATGTYRGSIVFQYFVRGKKRFPDLF